MGWQAHEVGNEGGRYLGRFLGGGGAWVVTFQVWEWGAGTAGWDLAGEPGRYTGVCDRYR